ncbi:hypothetical protein LTR08_000176 [Meristemomyces frigidus]|nr:hypothetical protein LTR08_000176 [Meristemomyces frigidus]
MGASDLPYLYDQAPSHRQSQITYPYSDFNPKAVTEASYARSVAASQPRPKREGPLINFNQHPDSYVVVSGTQVAHKPLPASTKTAIQSIRWVQFGLRVVQEMFALGLLVVTILIKGPSGAETYLLRIPQAWDSIIGIYAIYHLAGSAKSRQPGSSASYHAFALIMDVALIPLYVYIALLVNTNRHLPTQPTDSSGRDIDGNWRWDRLLYIDNAFDLLTCAFIGAAVLAGLHLLSCGLDAYLMSVFRKISHLPPDMNPLEDNLTTSRPRESKHKYKNSEITLSSNNGSTELSDAEKKRLAHLSGSTLSVGNASRTSVGKESLLDGQERSVPFRHSRTGSQTNLAFSPHNPESARRSRHQYDGQQELYQEAVSNPRRSRYEVRADGKLEVRTRGGSQSPSKRASANVSVTDFGVLGDPAKRNTFVDTFELPPMATPDRSDNHSPRAASYVTARSGSPASPSTAPNYSHVMGEQKDGLLSDNWYVLEEDASDMGSPSRYTSPASPGNNGRNGYSGIPTHDRHDSSEPAHAQETARPQPLGMHPPTPPMRGSDDNARYNNSGNTNVNRTLTAASNVTASSSIYSDSAPSLQSGNDNGTPKGRYYGDLAAAQRGVRGGFGAPPSPSRTPSPEKESRVISRSGADIADESVLYMPESKFSMRSRRDVSGKVAEEGRGSWGMR